MSVWANQERRDALMKPFYTVWLMVIGRPLTYELDRTAGESKVKHLFCLLGCWTATEQHRLLQDMATLFFHAEPSFPHTQ